MEKMPLFFLILYSVPESIILVSLSSALYGYKVKENLYRITLLGMSLALITYIVRALPIKMGLNIMIEIPLFIFLTSWYLKVSLARAFFYILTAFIVIALAEITFFPLISSIFHLSIKEMYASIFWRLFTGWIYLFLLIALTVFVLKTKYSLVSVARFFKPKTKDGKITLLIIGLVMIQATLSGSLNVAILAKESNAWPSFDNIVFIRVISFLIFSVPLISILLVKRLFKLSEQEAVAASQEAYISTVNDLFLAIRGQKHDFINHIQVITGLLQLGKNEEALKYGLQLGQESRETGEVLNIEDPTIAALIKSKISTCIVKQIRFKTNINAETANLAVKPYDLVRILGNLLDNAIDAVSEQKEDLRRVYFNIRQEHDSIVFEVTNLGPVILPEIILHIFNDGFTTKEQGHSGTGLAVVKQLVSQYKGRIEAFSNDEDGTTFTVTLPCKN
ncbi:MAG: sensor histidine kinase [Eubacteriales bacterium]